MKRLLSVAMLTILLSLSCLMSVSCGKKENPKLADGKVLFYQEWDRTASSLIDRDRILNNLATDFPDELNIEKHPDVIDPRIITGPMLRVAKEGSDPQLNNFFIPNMPADEFIADPDIDPDCVVADYYGSAGSLVPVEYLSDDRLVSLQNGEEPIVFMVVECIGYGESQEYFAPSGSSDTVYVLRWRTSFYSYPDCTLLAWESADRPYSIPESLFDNALHTDMNGNKVFQFDKDGNRIVPSNTTLELLYGGKN